MVGQVRQLLPATADPTGDGAPVDLDAAYAVPAPPAGGVHVRVNFVASVDGAAQVDGRSGGLGGPADRAVFRVLRGLADVVLVGAGTARAEDYGPVRLDDDRRARRRAAGQAALPRLAVVSGRLDLDPAGRLFSEPAQRPLVLTSASAPQQRRDALAGVADVVTAGAERVEVAPALAALAGLGLRRVLCEGGPSLFADLAAAGRVDELCLTLSPLLAGPGAGRIVSGTPWPEPVGMALAGAIEAEGLLLLRYARVHRADAGAEE